MNLKESLIRLEIDAQSPEQVYAAWGTTREEHQAKMMNEVRRLLALAKAEAGEEKGE